MTAHQSGMDWTDQAVSTLRSYWADGHSTSEIGRRMGITKNAVVGKAHRLKLPTRPSPIRSRPSPVANITPETQQQPPLSRDTAGCRNGCALVTCAADISSARARGRSPGTARPVLAGLLPVADR